MIIIELRNIITKLELPSDAILGDTNIEIVGKNVMYIENYKRITVFDEDLIVIQCKSYSLKISGICMQIVYYNNVELKIMGVINDISFC